MELLLLPFLVSPVLDPAHPWISPASILQCTVNAQFHWVQSGLSYWRHISLAALPWGQAIDLPGQTEHIGFTRNSGCTQLSPFFTLVEEEAQSGKVKWLYDFGIKPRATTIVALASGYNIPPSSLSGKEAVVLEASLAWTASAFPLVSHRQEV